MKNILFSLLILAASFCGAQSIQSSPYTSTGSGTSINETSAGILYHRLLWTTTGTVTTCQVKVEQSSDNASWSDLIPAQTCTSNGHSAWIVLNANFVRVNLTVLSGGGSINGTYEGFVVSPSDLNGMATGILQVVNRDAANTTTAQLASSATFTGAFTSTLGVSNYQVNVVTDQPVTINVDQSKLGSVADQTYTYSVPASTPTSPLTTLTFQMTNEFVRLRVTNNGGSTTTTLAVTAELCPICFPGIVSPPFTSALTLGSPLSVGAAIMEKGGRWGLSNSPAAGSAASASQAANAILRHVIDCIDFSAVGTTLVTGANVTFVVRDGASGAGTILWRDQLTIPTIAAGVIQAVQPYGRCGLNLIGTINTAMTCEFSAGVANVTEAVNCTGFDTH